MVVVMALVGDRIVLGIPDIPKGLAMAIIMMGDMEVYLAMVTRPLIGVNLAMMTSILVNTVKITKVDIINTTPTNLIRIRYKTILVEKGGLATMSKTWIM